jgi:predicted SnoaL-like aldol condensation-catalyzing enzyme
METNKQIALRALTGAFINRDPNVVEHFTANYIQHNPTIPNGPAAIKDLIPRLPKDFSYQPGMVVAEGDLVMVHGRYVGWVTKAGDSRRYIQDRGRQGGRALGCDAGRSPRFGLG